MQYLQDLKELGLSANQAKIYLTILQLKKATVLQVAKETGIQRPTIYSNTEILEKMGLISQIVDKGRKYLITEDPTILYQVISHKLRLAKKLVPQFIPLFQSKRIEQPQIKFFHGEEGLKKLTEAIPNSKSKIIRTIASYKENIESPFSDKFLTKLWESRVRKNVKAQVLFTVSDVPLLKKTKAYQEICNIKYNREVRILPEEIDFKVLYTLVDDKVLFWSTKEENYSFMFQSKSYSGSLKSLFDFLWKISSPLT